MIMSCFYRLLFILASIYLLLCPSSAQINAPSALATQSEYCKACLKHTACKYTRVNQDQECMTVKARGLTAENIAEVLKAHNRKRQAVAKQEDDILPAAANMVKLEWDQECAALAQLWVDQCSYKNDECRHTVKGGVVPCGQNYHIEDDVEKFNITKVIESAWFEEYLDFSGSVSSYDSNTGSKYKTSHFTQLVWATTTHVGCGYIQHGFEHLFACNYKPTGNVNGQSIWLEGKACSKCPADRSKCEDSLCTAPTQQAASVGSAKDDPAVLSRASPAKKTSGTQLSASPTPVTYPNLASKEQYCTVSTDHTACKYSGINETACGTTGRIRGLTTAQINELLKAHNDKRRLVAKGQQKGQPPAANMANLAWDFEAADIAQLWVDQCQFAHDQRRDTVKNGTLQNGQNIFWDPASKQLDIQLAMKNWFDNEVVKFNATNATTISSYQFDSSTGHYTQIVWANSIRIGCGYVFQNSQHLLACNFAPAGNMPGAPIYIIGTACSACAPDRKTCADGLCAY